MDDEEIEHWANLPKEERIAIREAARSRLFWQALGKRFKALQPFIATLLALIALWGIAGDWLISVLGKMKP